MQVDHDHCQPWSCYISSKHNALCCYGWLLVDVHAVQIIPAESLLHYGLVQLDTLNCLTSLQQTGLQIERTIAMFSSFLGSSMYV